MIDVALCIGINDYPGTGSDLAGCVNDARDWAAELDRRGARTFTILDRDATGANLLTALTDLVRSLTRGQTAVVTYSGHGTWVPDRDGDEPDRRDEALCPYDYGNGVITDDDLHDIFVQRHREARVVFISDSCHSGTVNRFAGPLNCDVFAADDARAEVLAPSRLVRFLPPEHFLDGAQLDQARAIGAARATRSRSSALLMAGCRDDEYSYDAWWKQPDGTWRANGAFTWVALDVLKRLPAGDRTYRDWMAGIRTMLPSQDYPQTPTLTGAYAQKRWPLL